MIHRSAENMNAEIVQNKTEELLSKCRSEIRKQAETMLGKSGADIARMSRADIEKLLLEFQVNQIELELLNGELKRTSQQLIASRDRYARFYNAGTVGYLALDQEGIIQHANLVAAQLLGCAKEMLVNKKLGEFIYPSDQDDCYFFIHNFEKKQTNQILNVRLSNHNDAFVYPECPGFNLTGCSLQSCGQNNKFTYVECQRAINENNKNDLQIYLTIKDITERKHAQDTIACLNEKLEGKILKQTSELNRSNRNLTNMIEELKHSTQRLLEREARLNSIFNASADGIITIDAFGIIVSVNTAVTTIFGYSEAELIGCSFNKLMLPSEKKKQGHNLKSYLQTKVPNVIGLIQEVEGMRKEGSLVPIDLSVAEFSIDGASYFTGIVRDVSSRKLQEQKEKEHLEELARVTRLCLMGELGSGIAHEVNQPLTAIANYTQACLRFIRAENPDLDQLGEILFKIHQQALKAGQIIHHMKDFVNSRKMYRSVAAINALIHNAVSLCIADFKQNSIRLELDLAENLPDVTIDSVQIEQVILNLIRNSIDALKDLPQKTQRQVLIQTHLNNHDDIEIRVTDNGSGIDEAQQEKILTPFYTTKSAGMGMGLSISRSIIEAHEGVLYFNSKPEEGATFYVTLPVKRKIK